MARSVYIIAVLALSISWSVRKICVRQYNNFYQWLEWRSLKYCWQRFLFHNLSRENCVANETLFSRKYHCESRKSHESRESRKSHESREKGKMRYFVKLASLALLKLVLILASLAMTFLFARLVRCKSCYEISVCETGMKRVSLRNLPARLLVSKSRYEISVCETHENQVRLWQEANGLSTGPVWHGEVLELQELLKY